MPPRTQHPSIGRIPETTRRGASQTSTATPHWTAPLGVVTAAASRAAQPAEGRRRARAADPTTGRPGRCASASSRCSSRSCCPWWRPSTGSGWPAGSFRCRAPPRLPDRNGRHAACGSAPGSGWVTARADRTASPATRPAAEPRPGRGGARPARASTGSGCRRGRSRTPRSPYTTRDRARVVRLLATLAARDCGRLEVVRRAAPAAGRGAAADVLRVCWPVTDPRGSLVLGADFGCEVEFWRRARRHAGRTAGQPGRRRGRRGRAGGVRAGAGVRAVRVARRHHGVPHPGDLHAGRPGPGRLPDRRGLHLGRRRRPGLAAAQGRALGEQRLDGGGQRARREHGPGSPPATSCATRCARCTASRPGSGAIFLVTDDQVPAWLDTDAPGHHRGQPPRDLRRHRAAADLQLARHRVAAAPHPGPGRALPLPQRRRVPGPAGRARAVLHAGRADPVLPVRGGRRRGAAPAGRPAGRTRRPRTTGG